MGGGRRRNAEEGGTGGGLGRKKMMKRRRMVMKLRGGWMKYGAWRIMVKEEDGRIGIWRRIRRMKDEEELRIVEDHGRAE